MNKKIDYSNLGGFPLTQDVLAFMQDSYRDVLSAIARLCGNKVIVYGVTVAGANVSDGWLVINGEFIPFVGGNLGTQVLVSETGTPLTFEDASVPNVLFTKTATTGAIGGFPFSDLVRLPTLAAQMGTIQALVTDLTNLTNDFNNHTHAWTDITNKPAGYITYVATEAIGSLPASDNEFTFTIPDQGSTAYKVIGTMRGLSANTDTDNDISWVTKIINATTFKVGVREYALVAQNLVFDFIIVKTL